MATSTTSAAASPPPSPNSTKTAASSLPILSPTRRPSSSEDESSLNGNIVQASFATAPESFEFFENEQDEPSSTTTNSSFWSLLGSLYLPVLCLWLRRSMFGTANLLRSLILGHLLRVIFGLVQQSEHVWLNSLKDHPYLQAFTKHQKDPHAWPPPAFTLLAALTIAAFCLHPDGLTWIMLGKTRDMVVSLLTFLGTGLGSMKDTYGILPTLFALATLAGLAGVMYVVYKTLMPRKRPPPAPSSKRKHKKKHKGRQRIRHPHHHYGSGNKKQQHSVKQQQQQTQQTIMETVSEETSPPSLPPSTTTTTSQPSLTALVVPEKPARSRILSGSTLDTLMDDYSCDGSTSVLSIASAPTVSSSSKKATTTTTKTTVLEQQEKQQKQSNTTNNEKLVPQKTTTTRKKPTTTSRKKQQQVRKNVVLEEPTSPTLTVRSAPTARNSSNKRLDGKRRSSARKTKTAAAVSAAPPSDSSFSFFSSSSPSQSFFSSSDQVRDNVPHLRGTGRNGVGRYDTPEKMELTAFLERVGLTGTSSSASLLDELDSVDALEKSLSSSHLARFGISLQKQREMAFLLEARKRSNVVGIGPPPGYGGSDTMPPPPPGYTPVDTSRVSIGAASNNQGGIYSNTRGSGLNLQQHHSNNINSGIGMVNTGMTSLTTPALDTGLYLESNNNNNMAANTMVTDTTIGGPTLDMTIPTSAPPATTNTMLPTIMQYHEQQQQPYPFNNANNNSAINAVDEDDSQIEQELQELGGQMVTSVLDF